MSEPNEEYWPFTRMKELMQRQETLTGQQVTYADVANGTGLSVSTVERYANNRVLRPDLRIVKKLCDYFQVSLSEFVVQEDPQAVAVA